MATRKDYCKDCSDLLQQHNTTYCTTCAHKHSADNDNTKGYVYIISNNAWPDWYKIGMAEDVDVRFRSYQTSSPFRDYVLEHYQPIAKMRTFEKLCHNVLKEIVTDYRNEWFYLPLDIAKSTLEQLSKIHYTTLTPSYQAHMNNLQE